MDNRCPNCHAWFNKMGDWQTICKPCYAKSKVQEQTKSFHTEGLSKLYQIDGELLRKIKQLSHPDKHRNSELSNSVMAELNKLSLPTRVS